MTDSNNSGWMTSSQDRNGHSGRQHRRRALEPLEKVVVAHLAVFCVAATWAYGGQADWVRGPLTAWGSIGLLITLAAVLKERGRLAPMLWWAAPVLVFNALVLVASLNPNLRELRLEGEVLLAPMGAREGWPSSARPVLARQALWEFNIAWIACFNLALVIRSRRPLRILLGILCANALILAVFGTVQKLVNAPGLYFGSVPSPQRYFFSTFVYHNHWGAWMLLSIATCFGLTWHYTSRRSSRDFFHSPAFAGLTAIFLLAATIPLSGSRSASVLVTVLLGAAGLHWTLRQIRHRRQFNESIVPPIVGVSLVLVLGAAGTWVVASKMIKFRASLTADQLGEVRANPGADGRVLLYKDTWQMGMRKPWFGWGMSSYPHVFMVFNTRVSRDRLPVYYREAHSDWLQAFAEHGAIGTTLLAACALIPIAGLRRFQISSLPAYLLGGCALLVLYAAIEFPFANYAVVLTWWTALFCAIQYIRLSGRPGSTPESRPSG